MSDFFAEDAEGDGGGGRRPSSGDRARSRRPRPLLLTIVVVAVLVIGFSLFAGIWTDKLWFSMLGYGSVFTKLLWTRVLLFVVFGGADGADRRASTCGSPTGCGRCSGRTRPSRPTSSATAR